MAKAERDAQPSGSGPSLPAAHGALAPDPLTGFRALRGGQGSSGHVNSWHHHLVQRSLVLFSVGVVLALVLNLPGLRNVTLFPDEVIATIFSLRLVGLPVLRDGSG